MTVHSKIPAGIGAVRTLLIAGVVFAAAQPLPVIAAQNNCTAVSGTIAASVVGGDPVTVLGTVSGDLAGATRAIVTSQQNGAEGTVELGLAHDFATDDRSTLKTNDKAVWTPIAGSPGVFHMATKYEVVGGTGRFAGASGQMINQGIADTNTGLVTLSYSGKICAG